jgi:hypothetical protein
MIIFTEFLAAMENGRRTSLGIYPPQYGAGQYPPAYFAPIKAGAANNLKNIHGIKCQGKGKCSVGTKTLSKGKKKSPKKK